MLPWHATSAACMERELSWNGMRPSKLKNWQGSRTQPKAKAAKDWIKIKRANWDGKVGELSCNAPGNSRERANRKTWKYYDRLPSTRRKQGGRSKLSIDSDDICTCRPDARASAYSTTLSAVLAACTGANVLHLLLNLLVLHSAWDVAGSLGNLHCLFASHAFDSANEEKMMKIHETTWKHMESMPV